MPTETLSPPVLRQGPAQEISANPTYLEAVGAALDHEMERDPDVFIIGEDVGQFGGAFKVTKGFLDKYGPRRVVDAPIAETGFTGLAAGAALRRAAAGGGVPVRRLHLLRLRPDHQRAGAPPLAQRRPDAGDDARPVRRPAAGRAHAQPERRGLLRARPGTEDRDAGHARGRRRAADQLDPGQQPDAVPGEQVPLPAAAGDRRRCRWSRSRSAWPRSSARAGTSR